MTTDTDTTVPKPAGVPSRVLLALMVLHAAETGLESFDKDPPDDEFQRGYREALSVLMSDAQKALRDPYRRAARLH
jgi:hypothetical protein